MDHQITNRQAIIQSDQQNNAAGSASTNILIEQLTSALIGLARAVNGNEDLIADSTDRIVLEALAATHSDAASDSKSLSDLLHRIAEEKKRIVPDCAVCLNPCGRTENYDMQKLWTASEDIRSLKLQILSGLRSIAFHTDQTATPHTKISDLGSFFYRILFLLGLDHWGPEQLSPIAAEVRERLKAVSI